MGVAEEADSKQFPANEPELDLYTIPSYSSWFSWEEIHDTEKESLKEFFDGSSISRTPKIYKEYRDFIINKYREEPSRKVTFTEIRKSLIGDVCLLKKVYLFLDKWGLINFGVAAAAASGDGSLTSAGDEERKKVRFEEGAPNGIRVVEVPDSTKAAALLRNSCNVVEAVENSFRLPPLASYSDVFGDLLKQKGLVCGTCGQDCVSGYYESPKGNLVICAQCLKSNVESKSVDEFKFHDRKVSSNSNGGSIWTEAETLLLLESVLTHGDDWDLVTQKVKTKNKLDCIARLIELPFGELMLDVDNGKGDERNSNSDASNATLHQNNQVEPQKAITDNEKCHENTDDTKPVTEGGIEEPPLKRRCIDPAPGFGESLMKQVAMLSTAVGPHVAAAAAEAAVTAVCNENPYTRTVFEGDENAVSNGSHSPASGIELERVLKVEDLATGEIQSQPGTEEATTSEKNSVPMKLRLRVAIATALGAAAARARLLVDQEDREIEHLVATVIEMQLKKLHSKIKHFEELELMMGKEYTQIQEMKESVIAEWIGVLRRLFAAGIPRSRDRASVRPITDRVFQ